MPPAIFPLPRGDKKKAAAHLKLLFFSFFIILYSFFETSSYTSSRYGWALASMYAFIIISLHKTNNHSVALLVVAIAEALSTIYTRAWRFFYQASKRSFPPTDEQRISFIVFLFISTFISGIGITVTLAWTDYALAGILILNITNFSGSVALTIVEWHYSSALRRERQGATQRQSELPQYGDGIGNGLEGGKKCLIDYHWTI